MRTDEKLGEILARMDARDARWEERDARWEEDRREENERWKEEKERWKEQSEEMRRWMDAMLARHAALTQELIAAIERLRVSSEEQGEQIRAMTAATWRMLDRFGEGPATA